MKVCDTCFRINPDDVEKCVGCGGTEFTPLLPPPFYNNWRENKSDGKDQ